LVNSILIDQYLSSIIYKDYVDVIYKDTSGTERKKRTDVVLTHFVNHTTHHTSQIATLFSDKTKLNLNDEILNSIYPISDITYYI
jgi:hypothetical protein